MNRFDFKSQILPPVLVELYDYWHQRVDGSGVMPRDRFDPMDIPRLLPHVFLMDVVHDEVGVSRRFKYRLTGTFIDQRIGRQIIGLFMEDIRKGETLQHLLELFERCVDKRVAAYATSNLTGESSPISIFHRLVLPVTFTGARVDQMLGGWISVDSPALGERTSEIRVPYETNHNVMFDHA